VMRARSADASAVAFSALPARFAATSAKQNPRG
jgi:hypothetical protein